MRYVRWALVLPLAAPFLLLSLIDYVFVEVLEIPGRLLDWADKERT